MGETVWLVSFDTDRIKDYIFATPDLKKIRGASALLEILNRADEKMLAQLGLDIESTRAIIRRFCPQIRDEEMVTGGGAAMAITPTVDLAKRVKAAVEGLYRSMTITGSTTGTCLEVPTADLQAPIFGQHVARLSVHLRQAKDVKGPEPVFPLTAYTRPCGACSRHPGIRPDPDEPAQALCRSCWQKHSWSDPAKNIFWQRFQEIVNELRGFESNWLQTEPPKDFGEIGRTSRPPGYLGFICADGNGIGSLLEKMRDFTAYHHFANGLDALVRRVTYRALLEVLKSPRQNTAPFEVLLMGGDDLMLVVAADAALEVALKITEYFEIEANALAHSSEVGLPEEEHLSLSTGVVIAHDSFPIKAMHDLASELLKSAKHKTAEIEAQLKCSGLSAKEQARISRGTIDFMVVTEAATAGLEVVRKQALSDLSFAVAPSRGEKFVLTERPYTVEQLGKLLDYALKFKKQRFPRKSLHAMYEALFQSKVQAQFVTLMALARAKDEHRRLGVEFFNDFNIPLGLLPWRVEQRDGEKHFYSPLGDLVEIYQFT